MTLITIHRLKKITSITHLAVLFISVLNFKIIRRIIIDYLWQQLML